MKLMLKSLMKLKVTTMKKEQWGRGRLQKQRDHARITQEPKALTFATETVQYDD